LRGDSQNCFFARAQNLILLDLFRGNDKLDLIKSPRFIFRRFYCIYLTCLILKNVIAILLPVTSSSQTQTCLRNGSGATQWTLIGGRYSPSPRVIPPIASSAQLRLIDHPLNGGKATMPDMMMIKDSRDLNMYGRVIRRVINED